jgi:hypothetical protein
MYGDPPGLGGRDAVTRIEASLPAGPRLLPGGKSPLVIVATTATGERLITKGAGGGRVSWDSFDIKASSATVSHGGVVQIPSNPRETDRTPPRIRITAKGRSDLAAELDVPLRYDGRFVADFSGAAGMSGRDGSDGVAGTSGVSASITSRDRQPGGDGGDGGDGSDGGSGGNGGDGRSVQVWVRLREGSSPPLLQVRALGDDDYEQIFLVDPVGGSLLVKSDGAPGGQGGRGGHGGSGGQGGLGTPAGRSGRSGRNGSRGSDGWDGTGGSITVHVDPSAKPFVGAIRFSNRDGSAMAKNGPPPVFFDEPVAPLW